MNTPFSTLYHMLGKRSMQIKLNKACNITELDFAKKKKRQHLTNRSQEDQAEGKKQHHS